MPALMSDAAAVGSLAGELLAKGEGVPNGARALGILPACSWEPIGASEAAGRWVPVGRLAPRPREAAGEGDMSLSV